METASEYIEFAQRDSWHGYVCDHLFLFNSASVLNMFHRCQFGELHIAEDARTYVWTAGLDRLGLKVLIAQDLKVLFCLFICASNSFLFDWVFWMFF